MRRDFADPALLDALASLASRAGARIMSHYGCGSTVKGDGSPVTAADHDAEDEILAGLATLLPGVPVLAEESAAAGRWPASTEVFVAVDPMDGTREFLSQNGEFTVNIAIIVEGQPVAGVVQAPALDRLWIGSPLGAEVMALGSGHAVDVARERRAIRTRPLPATGAVALVSRSHPDAASEAFYAARGITERRAMGSSLKYTLIAEGEADVSVRFASISEWDIAAAHAVLTAAGGLMTQPDGTPLVYGRADRGFRTDPFVACSAAFAVAGQR
jgi:3'(2'), 5'-bisphosphate nucleotidase